MEFKQITAGVLGMDVNTEMVLRDKNGNIKPVWQDNGFCMMLLKKGLLSI